MFAKTTFYLKTFISWLIDKPSPKSTRRAIMRRAERQVCRDDMNYTIILRVGAGSVLIPHGLLQLIGASGSIGAATLAQLGTVPGPETAYLIVFLELIGGICVMVGLFTRAFSGALALEMFWAASIFWSADTNDGENNYLWQFPLSLGIILVFIAVNGGGRWSVDRLIE
jgi:putative oxidoreductase